MYIINSIAQNNEISINQAHLSTVDATFRSVFTKWDG